MDLDQDELIHEIKALLIAALSLSLQLPERDREQILEQIDFVLENME